MKRVANNTTHIDLEQRIQSLANHTARSRHINSLVLGVETDDGAISVRAAAGAASQQDPYFIASITKMFTATIVMQLIDEKRLRLDDRVVELLAHLDLTGLHRFNGIDHTTNIEVDHLLHQTSGLADYFAGGLEEDFKHNRDRRYAVEDIVDIARTSEANFPPGDRDGRRSAYSDTNYQLLTAIIEAATGATYGETVNERIAVPLGLESTYVTRHEPMPEGRPPLPLYHKGQVLDLPQALASERGAGGVVSTLDDQLRFSAAFHQGRLFDPHHSAETRRWNRIFFPVDYGYGLMRYRLPRAMTGFRRTPELVGHSGATNSFTFYAPELSCHIVGTLNQLDNPSRAFRLITKLAHTVRKTQSS
ncbi:MAG: serine hydrolase domain-containing protein [Acidimicrobiales bacterium]